VPERTDSSVRYRVGQVTIQRIDLGEPSCGDRILSTTRGARQPMDSGRTSRAVRQVAALARPAGIHLFFAAVVALLAQLLLEAARTGWNWEYVGAFVDRDIGVIAVGSLVLMLATGVLLLVSGRMWLSSAVVLSVTLLLGAASHLKWVARREPIYPRDLVFLREPGFLLEMVGPRLLWITLAGVVPVALFSWALGRLFTTWLRRTPHVAARSRTIVVTARATTAVACVAVLSSLMHFNQAGNLWRATFESAGAHWAKASQPNNYRVNGFLGGFLYNLDVPAMVKPPGYSRATMEQIVARYAAVAADEYGDRDPTALDEVNVVSVLAESFSDPTRLAGMSLAEDPLPRTRALMERLPHGQVLTQKVGGGTASMEFEALTGMSLSQFDSAMDTPYQMLLPGHRTFPSVVELFNHMGHDTVAIHPYDPTMYQRDDVYRILGFDEFISQGEMVHRGRREDNPYISDLDAFRQTVDVINEHEAPVFVNLVTMQNHAPYHGKYAEPVGVEGLSDAGAEMVGQYARGLSYTDRAINRFITTVGRSPEKTVVVLYGDHQPAGLPGAVFVENSARVMHETPFFLYANFTDLEAVELPTTSPIYFMPRIFELVGAPLSPYYALLDRLEQHVSAMQHGRLVSHWDYDLSPEVLPPVARRLLREYRLVQYDLSVGQRYAEEMLYPVPAETFEASGPAE
jgi:phosphoglycerol transferase MdoB-like AlkP superfamily enzyme